MAAFHMQTPAEKRRLLAKEAIERRRFEYDALQSRMAETVDLAQKRGEEVEQLPSGRVVIVSRDGLDWLRRKGRLKPHQDQAADQYRSDWAKAQAGEYRSHLADKIDGCGVVCLTDVRIWAQKRIDAAERDALKNSAAMLPVVRGVCGHGYTLRDMAGGIAVDAARLEGVLFAALDLLAVHYGLMPSPADRAVM